MPGREDFGILRLGVLTDPRVHDAAARFVKARIAKEATALSTVSGVLALLGGSLARDTDNGELPGDPVFYLGLLGYDRKVAGAILAALRGAGLVEGNRLRGFQDCYSSLLKDRAASRARREAAREAARLAKEGGKAGTVADGSANRRGTDGDGSPVTGTVRYGPNRRGEDGAPSLPSDPTPEAPSAASTADPREVPEAPSRGPRINGGQRLELRMAGIDLSARAGAVSWWEEDIARLLADGVALAEIASTLKSKPLSLPPRDALADLTARIKARATGTGRRGAPASAELKAEIRRKVAALNGNGGNS
ncbi:MAG: hypothetical protein L6R43_08785 [Planctomycetes bacterium]|nr:hypothetical protein [Planctomycetota bacterium]